MAELNEQQLVLLNSLVYLDANYAKDVSVGSIVNDLLESGALDKMDIGGGMSKSDAEEMLRAIAADETLCSMVVDSCIDKEIRGVCFYNPETNGDAVIAYRGTGPAYAAWDDNCQGGYLSDTDMQKEALAFAQDCAQRYDDITVTGHSKGGNMAQYVTVLMGDEIDRCVSFDGQGFGDEFLEKYAVEIEANRHKIRSVNAYNDYVNILLTPIAGETVYLNNNKFALPGGHYIYELYRHKDNKLNDKGEYISSAEQAGYIKVIKEALDFVVRTMDDLDNSTLEFIVYSFVGMLLGAGFSSEADLINANIFDWIKIIGEFLENLDDYIEDYIENKRENRYSSIHLVIDTNALRDYGIALNNAATEIEALHSRVKRLQREMASNIISGVAIGLPLQAVLAQLDSEAGKLEKLAAVLSSCAEQYDTAETKAKGFAQ